MAKMACSFCKKTDAQVPKLFKGQGDKYVCEVCAKALKTLLDIPDHIRGLQILDGSSWDKTG